MHASGARQYGRSPLKAFTAAGGGQSTTTELRYTDGRLSAEYTHTCDTSGCTTPELSRSYVTDESGAVEGQVRRPSEW